MKKGFQRWWKQRFTVVSSSHTSSPAPSSFPSHSVSPLNNTWCKLTLISGEEWEERKVGRTVGGHRSESDGRGGRHEEDISG